MSNRALLDAFASWRVAGEPFALVTVIETKGSTYSKAGKHLLIKATGEHVGLLSGGCLEGDLAEHARTVINTGEPRVITYDMRDDADDLWGIGLGCNGLMRVLMQKVCAEQNWRPLDALADAMASGESHTGVLVIESTASDSPVGTCRIEPYTDSDAAELPCMRDTGNVSALHWPIVPWVRLLLLGAGPDAVPVVSAARLLGWEITVADHRPHYLDSGAFAGADHQQLVTPASMADEVQPDRFDAVVVMSHHLETDRIYLQQLAHCEAGYLGILGPPARKQKLLDDIVDGDELAARLRGPVGFDIGANDPASIALSLVSEIHAVLHEASGNALSQP